jgi:hypothetical protein
MIEDGRVCDKTTKPTERLVELKLSSVTSVYSVAKNSPVRLPP